MKRSRMVFGLMLAVLTLAPLTAAQALEAKSIDVYTSKDPQLAVQVELAIEKGYFKDEGLEVAVKYLSGGGEIPPGIAGGSIKLAMAAHNNALNVITRDFPVKVIGTINDISGAMGIAVRNALSVRGPRDLEGKKLGTFVYGGTMDFIAKMATHHGIDKSKIQIINLQPPDLAPTFARGDIDAALIWEPHLTRTAKQGGSVVLTGAQASFPEKKETFRLWGMPIVIFVTQDFLDKNPTTTVAYLKALARANDFVHASRNESIKILTKKLSIPEDDLTEMMGRNKYTMAVDDAFVHEMDAVADSLVAVKQIPKAPRASTYLIAEYMKKARPEWVTAK